MQSIGWGPRFAKADLQFSQRTGAIIQTKEFETMDEKVLETIPSRIMSQSRISDESLKDAVDNLFEH